MAELVISLSSVVIRTVLQFSLELSFQGSAHKDPIAVDLARNDPAPHFR